MNIPKRLAKMRSIIERLVANATTPSGTNLDNASKLIILVGMYEQTYESISASANEGNIENVDKLSVDLLEFERQVDDLALLVFELRKSLRLTV